MPEIDCYKRNRTVEIEFKFKEKLKDLPYNDRYTLILVTNGSINFTLNNFPIKRKARL